MDIDVDAAIQSNSELAKSLEVTKSQLDALKKSGDTSSATYVELEATYKSLRSEYNSSQRQIGKMLELQGKEIKTVQEGRNALSVLNREWAKQASLYGENSEQADELAKRTKEVRERVKELEKGVGDNTRNVGNYAEGMKEAIGQSTIFGRAQSFVTDIMNVAKPVFKAIRSELSGVAAGYRTGMAEARAYSGTQKAAAVSTTLVNSALKLMRIALISTGIGAIIVLIGSLVAWFSKTQKGIDLVNKALAGLGAFFDVVIDRLSKFGGAIVKLISGDLTGFFNDAKEAASGFGDEIAREVQLAIKLEEVFQAVEKAEINLDIRRSAANARLKELNLTIEDITKSEQERLKAAQEFARIESALVDEEVKNQERKVAGLLGFTVVTENVRDIIKQIGQEGVSLDQLGLSESTIEDAKEFRDEISKLFDLQTRSFEVQTTNQNKLNTITEQVRRQQEAAAKEAEARRKKAIDDAIKEQKVRLDIFIEQNAAETKSLEESLKNNEFVRDERLKILDEELKAGKKTQSEAELERLKIKKEFLDEQKELVVSFAEEELAIFKSANQSRIEENQLLNEALVSQEVDRLQAIAEKEREFQAERLEQGVISEREYNEAIKSINDEYRAAKTEIENQLKEQQLEQEAIEFENAQALRVERDGLIFEAKLAQLERDRQVEVRAAEKVGADITQVDAKFAALREQIKQQEADSKLQTQQELFGGIAQLLGQETIAGKAAGIAAATINTYQGVAQVWRAPSVLPEPLGTAQKVVSTGIVLGSGLSAVKKIASTNVNVPKAEKGGVFDIGGKRHAAGGTKFWGEDGTQFEAEQGEMLLVLNRNAAFAMNGLNKLYPAGGRRSGNYFADGGIVQRSISANQGGAPVTIKTESIDYDRFAQATSDAVRQLPPPITDVKDVINQVTNYNQVVNGANI
ncbi:coiled-coil domain-containing protein [Leeuwenhoekiella nanhaiensis]|uniref:hypothetical protein n=1 Tax=Leeuwenhoekiella nanhaiensis TaxID=1655491 RepID=UPI001179C434|nr:hypothetical protein [Leeuwenhoekiella nanhaiensis]